MSKDDNDSEFSLKKVSKKHNKNPLSAFYLVTQLGIYVIVCIFMCFYLGVFIDNFFDTGNLFKVIFLVIGILSSFIGVYKLVMKEMRYTKSDSDYLNNYKNNKK
ncbi:MAG: AtpZ/AtpI family protein [Lachnospirales bacterium]